MLLMCKIIAILLREKIYDIGVSTAAAPFPRRISMRPAQRIGVRLPLLRVHTHARARASAPQEADRDGNDRNGIAVSHPSVRILSEACRDNC